MVLLYIVGYSTDNLIGVQIDTPMRIKYYGDRNLHYKTQTSTTALSTHVTHIEWRKEPCSTAKCVMISFILRSPFYST
jgi:hypothetical protein